MKNIVVIGAGNIGSRHIQALKKFTNCNLHIFVVDPNPNSIKTAKVRCNEVGHNPMVKMEFSLSISELPKKIDLAIISTTADHRLLALEDIVKNSTLDYIIFEKFLFQELSEYKTAKKILKYNEIKAWVNCWPRTTNIFKKLKKEIIPNSNNYINVYGSNWGLASNAIHMIDLISYFFDSTNYNIENIINPKIRTKITSEGILSKSHFDLNGSIIGLFDNKPFSITSFDKGSIPLTIELILEDSIESIDVVNKIAYHSSLENNWISNRYKIEIPLQSESTNIHLEKILASKTCDLCDFETSSVLHSYFLTYLLENYNNTDLVKGKKCLIT